MSELTQCNYCSLQQIKRDARKAGKRVTVWADAQWGMGGVNVYVHPRHVNIKKIEGGEDGPRRRFHVAWFMELGSRCAC